jgi:hypothetical protein
MQDNAPIERSQSGIGGGVFSWMAAILGEVLEVRKSKFGVALSLKLESTAKTAQGPACALVE